MDVTNHPSTKNIIILGEKGANTTTLTPTFGNTYGVMSAERLPDQIQRDTFSSPVKPHLLEQDPAILKGLNRLAKRFSTQYPTEQYVVASFGRSPLMFVETLKSTQPGYEDMMYLSGSGFWNLKHYKILNQNMDKIVRDKPENFDRWLQCSLEKQGIMELRENFAAYKDYLQEKGMDPSSIVKRYAQTGKKTVLVDCTEDGTTIQLIARMFLEWSKDHEKQADLLNALEIHLYAPLGKPDLSGLKKLGFTVRCEDVHTEPAVRQFGETVKYIKNTPDFGIRFPIDRAAELKDQTLSREATMQNTPEMRRLNAALSTQSQSNPQPWFRRMFQGG